MSTSSLLPFITEALNEIFGRMDKIQHVLEGVNASIVQSMNTVNQSMEKMNKNLTNLTKKMTETGGFKGYRENTKILFNIVENINENFWYLDFLTALQRILSVVNKLEG